MRHEGRIMENYSMYAWLIETFGEQNALYIAYGAGALGFLLLVWVLWFWTRRVSGGVFVHGGRAASRALPWSTPPRSTATGESFSCAATMSNISS
jgi:hypothetical protein